MLDFLSDLENLAAVALSLFKSLIKLNPEMQALNPIIHGGGEGGIFASPLHFFVINSFNKKIFILN